MTVKANHILHVDNLSWQREDKNILSDIGFTLDQGEFMGVIGPNGAGKPTLLRCLCQFITDHQGTNGLDHDLNTQANIK